MRMLIASAAVAMLALAGALVNMDSAVAQSNGPLVTIDSQQLPLPVVFSGSVNVGNRLVVVPASDLSPYQQTRTFFWGTPACVFTAQACELNYSPVPAGKRLIVENVSGTIIVNAGSAVRTVELSGAGTSRWYVPAALQSTFIEASTFAVNAQVLAHFEAGQTPKIFINTDSSNLAFSGNAVTLSGHFVDVP